MDFTTPGLQCTTHGTQILARVLPDGKSFIQVLEGRVDLENTVGKLSLEAGEAGEAAIGQAPHRTAVIDAKNILQWALYYPAVLDLADLGLAGTHAESAVAYRKGNLLEALKTLPAAPPQDTNARLYRAGVLLAVGSLDEARQLLSAVPPNHPGRRALERMIDAVLFRKANEWRMDEIKTASEAIAESYYLQSRTTLEPLKLESARLAALRATELAPGNGYAWTRLAELEFSAGHTKAARAAIEKGMAFTPENARAHALRGFILSSENRIDEARLAFETSIKLDGGFGNGWLGLGLTKIKKGDLEAGRTDLQTAATVEPNSSLFHSYLAKAMSQGGLYEQAAKDLKLAKSLDEHDPTPWLYSALLHQEQYQPNMAISELEKSIELNRNRRLYRSALLLDQDQAVRGANLAKLYQYNDMKDVAVREATRAVESDYTNPSAHLFLANSFDALRDPNRILLRYETPWFNELLLSNLLSPVGGGQLSQFVSQQEYSKLLAADGVGGNFTTEWRDTTELRTTASVFGTEGNVSYGLDAYYRNDPGDRPNSDMEQQEFYGQFKWQASPDDIVYFLGKWAGQQTGDKHESYNYKNDGNADLSFKEDQHPGLLLAGWNHRWSPGSNTLLLVGKLGFEQSLSIPDVSLIRYYDHESMTANLYTSKFNLENNIKFDVYSAEIQHIFQMEYNTLIVGGRLQEGQITGSSSQTYIKLDPDPSSINGLFENLYSQHENLTLQRTGLYGYEYWNILPQLTVIGGFSWDTINHPDNFRYPPLSNGQKRDEDFSAKFGFTYAPSPWVNLRGLAAGGMGGVSFDESVRLEPSQLAGFNQAYRTVISESLAGSVEAPLYQIYGLGIDGVLPTHTWWEASVEAIGQKVSRATGIFRYDDVTANKYVAGWTTEDLDYQELCLSLTLNQLIGDELSIGAEYRWTASELHRNLPELLGDRLGSNFKDKATLQELSLYADWNAPTGFFVHLGANGFAQHLEDDPSHKDYEGAPAYPRKNDELLQFNAWLGYRFNQNRSEISAGVLNIGNTDYQLSPLNSYSDIARERTFFVKCRFGF